MTKTFAFLLATSLSSAAQSAELTLIINNVTDNSPLSITFYDNEADFLSDNVVHHYYQAGQKGTTKITFNNLPDNKLAFTVFADLNRNNQLDRSFLGIPQEPYAFSNNATGTMGPAEFKDAKFDPNAMASMTINLID
ncbi:DUF2141 domain-containing protein [Motilimonas pumila]|uniref:DUF2141 domain-containing protein n=1 Tax=Motilimonas pumila TaxID=2303987 RepID=A0A418YK74_9GAMM|nr:DUF2141 domain-containing protein [Motilimonas pumila]RJG51382.1 DUF2141 domain-containing protein [Motilimonas pumila]